MAALEVGVLLPELPRWATAFEELVAAGRWQVEHWGLAGKAQVQGGGGTLGRAVVLASHRSR